MGVLGEETPGRACAQEKSGVADWPRRLHHSYQEYWGALELSGVKLEYCEGEIYAMAGGTPAHTDLAASVTRTFHRKGGRTEEQAGAPR